MITFTKYYLLIFLLFVNSLASYSTITTELTSSLPYSFTNKSTDGFNFPILKQMQKISDNSFSVKQKWMQNKNIVDVKKEIPSKLISTKEREYLKQNKNITLATISNWDKFSFKNQDNKLVGFNVDLINQMNLNLNLNLKLKFFPTWKKAYESVKTGETDGIFSLSWTKEREKYFLYSPTYRYIPFLLVTSKATKNIKDTTNLKNKTIITHASTITNTIIKKISPSTKIIHAKNRVGMLSALKNKEADFALFRNIEKEELSAYKLKIQKNLFFKEGNLHLGVNKNKVLSSKIVNKALASISKDQMQTIGNKWFLKAGKKSIFTKKELHYLNSKPIIKIGIEDLAPIVYSKNGKTIDGIMGDIFKRIKNFSGLRFNVEADKWHVLLEKFKNKELDVLPASSYTNDRSTYGLFTQAFLNTPFSIFAKKSKDDITSLASLKNKKLIIQKSYAIIDTIKELFPDIIIIESESLEESIYKVLNGEVDALFSVEITAKLKLNSALITSLKTIYQNEIPKQKIHMFSQVNNPILHSILIKSLYSISILEKNEIISKWIQPDSYKKNVNIALKKGRDPFVISNNYLKGIEYELVERILAKSDIGINAYTMMDLETLNNGFLEKKLDVLVSVKPINSNYFYSDDFSIYTNVAVSRKEDKLKINSIMDLKGKKIAAFEGASKHLSKEYKYLFSKRTKHYQEVHLQEDQVKALLDGKVDVVVMDINIFKWNLKKLSSKSSSEFTIDYIFNPNNDFKVAFKDQKLRDIFNKNLKRIKITGEYNKIIDSYIKYDINAKVKINTLISALVSKSVFNVDIKEVHMIIDVLSSLDYIEKIEVYTDELLAYSTALTYENSMTHDIYYNHMNIPKKLGYIKVYFNESKLIKASNDLSLIPDISLFERLSSFVDIKKTYQKFNYLKRELVFTKREKEFISKHPIMRFSEVNWQPLSIIENKKFNGLIDEYMKIIEEKTGISFKYIPYKSWNDILKAFEEDKLDFIPSVPNNKKHTSLGKLSQTYEKFNFSVVMNKEGDFLNDLSALKGKTVAIPSFYTSYNHIKKYYPSINVIATNNIPSALALVVNGKVDAFVGHEAVSAFYIKNFFPELKIVGITQEKFRHHFLIQDEHHILVNIINKVLQNISYSEKENIRNKWIKNKVNTAVDYKIIYQLVFIFLLILTISLYFIAKLRRANLSIKEQKKNFETLFMDAHDGLVLYKYGKIIDCNISALALLKYEKKEDFLNKPIETLSPALQPNGDKSSTKFKSFISECFHTGSKSFEWVHLKSSGEHCWLDIVLSKIMIDNEYVIHCVWRDIGEKKLLEAKIKRRSTELEEKNLELNNTNEHIKQMQLQLIDAEKMASLGSLVAGVSHEINTPIGIGLTSVSYFVEMSTSIKERYKNDLMTQEAFEDFLSTSEDLSNLIYKNLKKAAVLIKSFKTVAVDQSSEEKREFYFREYIEEILNSIHPYTKKTNIVIELNCDEKLKVNSYPGPFSQVITNLIMNSIIHGFDEKEKGLITIDIKEENEQTYLLFKDNGKGIKKENIEKIFDPFFTTNRENGGSGLGLNIIYNIITKILKGSITCKSIEKEGVVFEIRLNI